MFPFDNCCVFYDTLILVLQGKSSRRTLQVSNVAKCPYLRSLRLANVEPLPILEKWSQSAAAAGSL